MPNIQAATLPLARDDVMARAWASAREWVERGLRGEHPDGIFPLGMLHPDGGRVFHVRMMKWYAAGQPGNLMEVIDWARCGSGEADDALQQIVQETLDRGERLSQFLEIWLAEKIHPQIGRRFPRRSKSVNFLQDLFVTAMVIDLCRDFQLRPVRRRSSAKASACFIVSKVLADAGIGRGSERAIEKVWQRYRSLVPLKPLRPIAA